MFRGLRLACSRLEAADVRAISALVTYHGGVCQRRLDAACTHLVVGEADGVSVPLVREVGASRLLYEARFGIFIGRALGSGAG